jgi:anti-anti-sigma factor
VDATKPFEFERLADYSRLTLGAQMNGFHWEDLQRSAQEILSELESGRHQALIVDLTQLDYLGSAQLTVLVRIWKVVKEKSGRMIVEVNGPVVREVLKTAGLLNVWELAESRAGALQMLGLRSDGRQKTSLLLPAVGLAALAAVCAGIGLTFWRAGAVDARAVLAGQLACSAIALGSGLWTAISCTKFRRSLGAGIVVASAVLAVLVVFQHPRSATGPSASAPERSTREAGGKHSPKKGPPAKKPPKSAK